MITLRTFGAQVGSSSAREQTKVYAVCASGDQPMRDPAYTRSTRACDWVGLRRIQEQSYGILIRWSLAINY